MTLPKEITIFGNTIDVIEVDCLNEASGDFSPVTNTIHVARHTLSDGIKCELSPKQREQTFWHEVFHAFQYYSTGKYDEAQSQVYAGFLTGLGIDIVFGKNMYEPLTLGLICAGLRGEEKELRANAREMANRAAMQGQTLFSRRIRECLNDAAKSADDGGAVPAEEYRGHDYLLFGIKQQIESGDKDALRRAVKTRDDARKRGNYDFANKIDKILNEYQQQQTE